MENNHVERESVLSTIIGIKRLGRRGAVVTPGFPLPAFRWLGPGTGGAGQDARPRARASRRGGLESPPFGACAIGVIPAMRLPRALPSPSFVRFPRRVLPQFYALLAERPPVIRVGAIVLVARFNAGQHVLVNSRMTLASLGSSLRPESARPCHAVAKGEIGPFDSRRSPHARRVAADVRWWRANGSEPSPPFGVT